MKCLFGNPDKVYNVIPDFSAHDFFGNIFPELHAGIAVGEHTDAVAGFIIPGRKRLEAVVVAPVPADIGLCVTQTPA